MTDDWTTVSRNHNYEVNSVGDVRNSRNGYVLTGSPNNSGYLTVSLGKRLPGQFVHSIVAEAFVPGYKPGLDVDHIDGNKKNNRADNLKWRTRSENIKRAYEMGLATPHRSDDAGSPPIKVEVVETGEVFNSISDCARAIGGNIGTISMCVNGLRKKHKDYHFRRVD